jgi:nitrate reductase NapAB chaperone NapD
MKVNELIERLNQFNPDGKAQVCVRPREYDDEGVYDYVDFFSLEENSADGKLVVLIHTSEEEYTYENKKRAITVQELITKLNKFNPDGNATVYCNNLNYHEHDDYCEIHHLSMNDADGQLVIAIHTYEI